MQYPWFPDLRGDDESPDAYGGGRLEVDWVLAAYLRGFFPWPAEGEPLAWWCPRIRMVFEFDSLHLSRRLARTLRQGRFSFSLDRDFDAVLGRCRDQRGEGRWGTWITSEVTDVYRELHQRGVAHSIEVWEAGELAGGVYGLALGGVFFGESMFSDRRDASKAGLIVLGAQLKRWGFSLFDCQVPNPHLVRMGGCSMHRSVFLQRLAEGLLIDTRVGPWQLESAALPPGAKLR